MKKFVAIVAGLATLATASYVGGRVWAQQGNTAAPKQSTVAPLQTRVGLVNIGQVIKNYNKFKVYQDQMKRDMEPVQKQVEAKKQLITAKQTQGADPKTTVPQREQLEKEVKVMQREIQDMVDEANNKFSKLRVDQLVTIYKDVQGAVTAYSRANGFELVMQYSDSTDPAEKYSPASLQQKLGNMACFPVYNHEQMEITNGVTDMLNKQVPMTSAAPTAPAPAGQTR
jgi:Skp family chaperone for outer membrane proteins